MWESDRMPPLLPKGVHQGKLRPSLKKSCIPFLDENEMTIDGPRSHQLRNLLIRHYSPYTIRLSDEPARKHIGSGFSRVSGLTYTTASPAGTAFSQCHPGGKICLVQCMPLAS